MAPAFVGYAASSHSGSVSACVIPAPAGAIVGDLLIAFVVTSNAQTWTGPAGWTERLDRGAAPSLAIYTGVHDGSTSYTFTETGSGTAVGHIHAYRSQSYDLTGTAGTSTSSNIVIPSITKTGAGFISAVAASTGNSSATHGTPSGMTATVTTINTNAVLTTFWQAVATGATGTRTVANTVGNNAGVLVGVKN